MTCREKLAIEHPACVGQNSIGGADQCPHSYGYMSPPVYCPYNNLGKTNDDVCGRCWDREIPEETKTIYAHIGPFGDLSNAVGKIGEAANKAGQSLESVSDGIKDMYSNEEKPHILDSGNRTVFESGAVRDIQEGKGRCDLLPLDVVALWLKDTVLDCIQQFIETGKENLLFAAMTYFISHEPICWDRYTALLETAIHYEEGAKKYDENNWKKGIPVKRYIDSAVRHYLKFLRGDTDERHDRAFCWNIMGAIWTCKHMPELNEYRIKLEGEK